MGEDGLNVTRVLIDEPAARWPDRVAIVAASSDTTYAALSELTNRVGNVLLRLGCLPGDRVLLVVPDSPELVAALLAVIKIGALAVPVPPFATASDLEFYVRDTGACLAIVHPAALDAALAATAAVDVEMPLIVTGDVPASGRVWPWPSAIRGVGADLDARLMAPDAAGLVLYTSGSTGRQKAAVHAHRAVIAAIHHVGCETFGIASTDRLLSTARLSFAFGLGFGLSMPLGLGAATILKPTRDLRELARIIAVDRPTILCGVPSLLAVLLRASASWLALDLSSLRFIVSAGEPLPPEVYDGYRDRFGVEVLDGIGSTEMLTHFISHRPGRSRRATCGTPVSGCEVRLVDDRDRPVADGEIGSLRVHADTAFLGYWNRPEATASIWNAQGMATGDRMCRDPHGDYRYCGRDDDMVKVSGLWVTPGEIESALSRHPNVERCVVTTREDRGGHRRLVAYIIPRSPAALRVSELYGFAAEQLPAHMIPAAFVALAALPLTPNGKVKRSDLPAPDWAAGHP